MPITQARRQGRRFILLDCFLVVFGFYSVFPLVSVHFADQMGWATATVGAALAMRQLAQQGLGLFGGSLADRFGAKPMIIAGMLLRASSFVVMAMAHNVFVLVLSCALSGLGGMLFDPPRGAMITKLVRARERERFYALLVMQESVVAAGAALTGTWLLHFDFYWVCLCGCLLFCLAALANAIWLPAWRVSLRPVPVRRSISVVLADKSYLALVLTLSGYYVLYAQSMMLLPLAVKQLTGNTMAVGWMFTMQTLLSLAMSYPLSWLGGRYLTVKGRVQAGLALMCFSLLAMSQISHPAAAFAVLGLFFIGILAVEPAKEMLVSNLANSRARAAFTGTSRIGMAIGGASGHLGGGWLQDCARQLHHPALPWLTLSAAGLLTLYTLNWLLAPHRPLQMRLAQS